MAERISCQENCKPSKFVVSVFHPSSWCDHLLDHCPTRERCTNCGHRDKRWLRLSADPGMVGTRLARTITLSGLPSRSTAFSTRSCNSVSSSTISGSANLGLKSCQHLSAMLPAVPPDTHLHSARSAVWLFQPSDSFHFHEHVHATSRLF